MSDLAAPTATARDAEFFGRMAEVAMKISPGLDAGLVSAALAEARDLCGADGAAFASFLKEDEAYESYRFVLACEPTWCLFYESKACYMHDPWLEYTRTHAEATLADAIPARTAQEKEVVALARQFGFASAIVVPVHSPPGLSRISALCIGSARPGAFDEEAVTAVSVAVNGLLARLQAWQIAALRNELLDRTEVSEDDMQLLRHQWEGRSSKEVAAIMNTTSHSIDSRWQRLNARLGVSSRAAAARLAAEYGLI
jgi:DNA-binding CsgD family transcriptional regulator